MEPQNYKKQTLLLYQGFRIKNHKMKRLYRS